MPDERLSCREAMDSLESYVSDALPTQAVARFEAHLAVCAACVAYIEAYRATVRIARRAHDCDDARAELPDELVRAILAARAAKSS